MKTRSPFWFIILTVVAGSSGCQWFAVTYSALNYPETEAGESANVTVVGTTAYGTLGANGFEVVRLERPDLRLTVPPPPGSESVDDLAVAEEFLFALDAREPGHLSVFSLHDSLAPVLVSGPTEVGVGPFSGVSAGNGHVIVSGGTSSLSLFSYDAIGRLSINPVTTDLVRRHDPEGVVRRQCRGSAPGQIHHKIPDEVRGARDQE